MNNLIDLGGNNWVTADRIQNAKQQKLNVNQGLTANVPDEIPELLNGLIDIGEEHLIVPSTAVRRTLSTGRQSPLQTNEDTSHLPLPSSLQVLEQEQKCGCHQTVNSNEDDEESEHEPLVMPSSHKGKN